MKMPFGKHKGKDISDIPEQYLLWVWNNVDITNEELYEALDDMFGDGGHETYRRPTEPPKQETKQSQPSKGQMETIVKIWSAKMANKYHPDRGGSHEQMIVVNEGLTLLRKLIAEN